ncbi:M48 family metallopeptidase [Nocardioides panacihumi]|uniref:M48 family metallopeptidase n=1 Tax=Nocardioides panacihumi TaxID=400774 RepID=UPI0031D9C206
MPTPETFARRLDARVAEALDRRLVDRISTGRSTWLARAAAFLLVTPVHLVSIALAAGGVALAVLGGGWWQWSMAAFLLGVAWMTRPRVWGSVERDTILVDPAEAPLLTALVADVADLLGTRAPDEIRLDSSFNAYVAARRFRGRQLVLGAPLWAACEPQSRIALLGHEVGHLAHGDLLSLRYVGSAYSTLSHWVALLDPMGSEVFLHSTPVLVRAILAPPRWLVLGYLRLVDAVNSAASRRQELYADLASALAAGTDGAVDSLEVGLIHDGVDAAANRAAVDPTRPALGESIAARVAAYDAGQREAARRRGASDGRSIDASHPPTVDRLRLIESVERSTAAVVLDPDRSRLIDKELAPHLEQAFKRLGDRYRFVR